MNSVPTFIAQAADTRAAGLSWAAAAAEASRPLTELRAWIRDHRREWNRELRRARREAKAAVLDEAFAVLRTHLRSQEEKTSLQAAIAIARHQTPTKKKPAGKTKDEVLSDIMQHLDALEAYPPPAAS